MKIISYEYFIQLYFRNVLTHRISVWYIPDTGFSCWLVPNFAYNLCLLHVTHRVIIPELKRISAERGDLAVTSIVMICSWNKSVVCNVWKLFLFGFINGCLVYLHCSFFQALFVMYFPLVRILAIPYVEFFFLLWQVYWLLRFHLNRSVQESTVTLLVMDS